MPVTREGEKIIISYSTPATLEVEESQIIAGQAIVDRIDAEVTSEITSDRLPEEYRSDFINGKLKVFSTDIDAWVVVKIN